MRPRSLLLAVVLAAALAGPTTASASAATCDGHKVTIRGTPGNDTIVGHERVDVIEAGAGDDTIRSKGGSDIISGGEGNDYLNESLGDGTVDGGPATTRSPAASASTR
jgi:Ca2+-binding RTX toxin-like protein